MRNILLIGLLALSLLPAGAQTLRGDYVEARTCSVYAGGCHYSGEYVTAGREALLFWHIREGQWNGVDVGGLSVFAAVVANNNLAEPSTPRKSVLYIDAHATQPQRKALTSLFSERYANLLGDIRAVKTGTIRYTREDKQMTVDAPGVAILHISRYPCKHCVQPHQVWYHPLVPIVDAEVASAKRTAYLDRQLGIVWQRGEENSIFVGEFTVAK
ncbi:MAG: DUF1326 domain-containing protein [Armatimonadota bacterium]